MADEPEVIRKQMEDTRASLTEKLEALETQVAGTVQSTTETVAETVEAVKETVAGTVDAVKETVENVTDTVKETAHSVAETFNLKLQFERHPWEMFGGSIAVGALAGYFLTGKRHRRWEGNGYSEEEHAREEYARPASFAAPESRTRHEPEPNWSPPPSPAAAPERQQPEHKGWLWDTMGRLGGLAVGSLMGVVRDLAARSLPESLQHRVAEEIDTLTTKLGGEPVQGHVLPEEK